MKTKHSPAPWFYEDFNSAFLIQDSPDYEGRILTSYDYTSFNKETAEANAKLMAAGDQKPEMVKMVLDFANKFEKQLNINKRLFGV